MSTNVRAIGLLLASIGFITVVDTIAKLKTADLHPLHIVWGYFFGISLTLGTYAMIRRRTGFVATMRTRRLPLHMARTLAMMTSIGMLFIALQWLPLADCTAINFTSPLFITALSVPMLGERVGPHRWAAVAIGLAGVLLIVQPGSNLAQWAALLPLAGAFFFALYQLTTRVLSSTEPTFRTLMYTGVGGLFWCSLLVPFFWRPMELADWGLFVFIGLLGAAAHLCLISAFGLAEASLLAPFNYSKIIWATIAGYLVFGELPTLNTLAGAAIIAAAGLYVLWRENRSEVSRLRPAPPRA
ncbi:MAG: DMT family transporter [Alphaproteobacteria bacterium]